MCFSHQDLSSLQACLGVLKNSCQHQISFRHFGQFLNYSLQEIACGQVNSKEDARSLCARWRGRQYWPASLLLSAKETTHVVKKSSVAAASAVMARVGICLFGVLFPTQYIFFIFYYRNNNLGLGQKQLNNSETGDFYFFKFVVGSNIHKV